ncbi:unnamed protein product [Peronospora destructor]|uniref:DUF4219 domain-containing protein n=1 Tax=Peronospora destructor TaxID=86335 RepID=A0AAV0U2X6_9STRA|nr:unnamed protein product [Peronospora destructor]
MDTSTTSARIDKFDGTNFHVWKIKMQMVLEKRDLRGPSLVRSSLGAFEAWTKLVTHVEKKSLGNSLFLRRRLFATVMEDGDDVLEHINKLRTLAEISVRSTNWSATKISSSRF